MNSIKIKYFEGFIIKNYLEMKRNMSVSWRGQLVPCYVGGLGSDQDQ
jgi:hypothetical protein